MYCTLYNNWHNIKKIKANRQLGFNKKTQKMPGVNAYLKSRKLIVIQRKPVRILLTLTAC